jgi:hypothetical protein
MAAEAQQSVILGPGMEVLGRTRLLSRLDLGALPCPERSQRGPGHRLPTLALLTQSPPCPER